MKTPNPLNELAFIRIALHEDGEMSIDGNIGDVRLAIHMIDGAREAVNAQWRTRTARGGLLIPDQNPTFHEDFPVVPVGDR